jgi:hypothetical protein
MTQYLTQMNGMPADVEKKVISTQQDWMWGGAKSSPVGRDMLLAPIGGGGKNMFDLKARNEAIQMMTLKSYLEMDPNKRSKWAFFGDKLLAKRDKKGSRVQAGSHINMFMQKYSPKLNKLPAFLKGMLTCAKKYGVEFDTLHPSREIRNLLPLWHHHGEDPDKRQTNNTPQCKCLRKNHGVKLAGEGIDILTRLDSPSHSADPKCICNACIDDRLERRCKNPHRCAVTVRDRLTQIRPKWDPQLPETAAVPEIELAEGEEKFEPPPEIKSLYEGFRIFTKVQQEGPTTAAPPPEVPRVPGEVVVTAVVSGYVSRRGLADAQGARGFGFLQMTPGMRA